MSTVIIKFNIYKPALLKNVPSSVVGLHCSLFKLVLDFSPNVATDGSQRSAGKMVMLGLAFGWCFALSPSGKSRLTKLPVLNVIW